MGDRDFLLDRKIMVESWTTTRGGPKHLIVVCRGELCTNKRGVSWDTRQTDCSDCSQVNYNNAADLTTESFQNVLDSALIDSPVTIRIHEQRRQSSLVPAVAKAFQFDSRTGMTIEKFQHFIIDGRFVFLESPIHLASHLTREAATGRSYAWIQQRTEVTISLGMQHSSDPGSLWQTQAMMISISSA
jgi:hypothetical protein